MVVVNSTTRRSTISITCLRASALIWAEFRGNIAAFLFPLPIVLGLYGYNRFVQAGRDLSLTAGGIWVLVVAFLLTAMVYGLQSFSREADRRTLDFMLSRPLTPRLVVGIKYIVGLGIMLGWYGLIISLVELDLSKLPLPKGMGLEWLIVFMLSVHAMGFFAGIIGRGLERFLMVCAVSGILGWLSYLVWQAAFDLMTANYYWFDIPSAIYGFVSRDIPFVLMILCIAPPLAGTLWHLHGRPKPWRFAPLRGLAAAWLLAGLFLLLAQAIFAPPLWPDRGAVVGDWHGNSIVLVTAEQISDEEVIYGDKRAVRKDNYHLQVAKFGRRARTIYSGVNLAKPRWSPDGRWIAFAEDNMIKAIRLRDQHLIVVGPGYTAAWSHDSSRLILARSVGAKGKSRLYLAGLDGNPPTPLCEETYVMSDLAWDSLRQKLYLVGYYKDLSCLDLNSNKVTAFSFAVDEEPSIYFGVGAPSVKLDTKNALLYLGLINIYKLQVYTADLENGSVKLVEEKVERRMQTGAPLLMQPERKALIWPRIDGSFVYQTIFISAISEESP